MTRQRKAVFEKLKNSSLAWGYNNHGGKDYFFTDGSSVSQSVVEGMLAAKLLLQREDIPGVPGQEIIAA